MMDPNLLDTLRRDRLRNSARNPGLAALMSFFVMGLGQIYAGHVDRGVILVSIHLASILAGFSLYAKGFVYEIILPMTGPALLVIATYILSVILILLWIYNIKDAYYLSLFSGVRDLFEVERVLVPFIQESDVRLLTAREGVAHPAPEAPPATVAAKFGEEISDAEPADETVISVTKVVSEKKPPRKSRVGGKKNESEKIFHEIDKGRGKLWSNLGAYAGALLVIFLFGWGVIKNVDQGEQKKESAPTLFSLSSDLSVKAGKPAESVITFATIPGIATGVMPIPAAAPAVNPIPDECTLGIQSVSVGDLASGIPLLERGLFKNPSYAPGWQCLLKGYRERGDDAALEDALKRYLKEFPKDAESWVDLGSLQYNQKSFVDASRSLIRCLEIAPTNIRGNFILGVIFRELQTPDEAIPYLLKAHASDPLNPEFNKELGVAYLEMKDFKAARKHLERSLQIESQDEQVKRLLAELEEVERQMAFSPNRNSLSGPLSAPEIPSLTPTGNPPLTPESRSVDSRIADSVKPVEKPARSSGHGVVLWEAPGGAGDLSSDLPLAKFPLVDRNQRAPVTSLPPVSRVGPLVDAIPDEPAGNHPAVSGNSSVSQDTTSKTGSDDRNSETPAAPSPTPGGDGLPPVIADTLAFVPNVLKMVSEGGVPSDPTGSATPAPSTPVAGERVSSDSSPGTDAVKAPDQEAGSGKQEQGLKKDEEKSGKGEKPFKVRMDEDGEAFLANSEALDTEASPGPVALTASAPINRPTGAGFSPLAPEASRVPFKEPSVNNLWTKGFDLYLEGKWEEALPPFLEYLKKKEDPKVYGVVGVIFDKLGLPNDAYEAMNRSYQLGNKDIKSIARLGQLAEKCGKYEPAARFIQEALSSSPHRLDLRILLARCLRHTGDLQRARSELDLVLNDPNCSYAVRKTAQNELSAFPGAAMEIEESVKDSPASEEESAVPGKGKPGKGK